MDFGQIHLHVRVLCGPKTGWGPAFCGEMDELASKLFKTFFRSKKSFLSSELEFVEVSSKMENFRKFPDLGMVLCICGPYQQIVFKHVSEHQKSVNPGFVRSLPTTQTLRLDFIFDYIVFRYISNSDKSGFLNFSMTTMILITFFRIRLSMTPFSAPKPGSILDRPWFGTRKWSHGQSNSNKKVIKILFLFKKIKNPDFGLLEMYLSAIESSIKPSRSA